MGATVKNKHEGAIALCESVNEIFGRWPLWPWTVLGLIVAGGGVGLANGPTLRGFGESGSAALGSAACAGYGMVAAAMLSLLPRLAKLALLQRNIIRRPTSVEDSWWPLKLLGPALLATPSLRRTPEEFRFAVDSLDPVRSTLACLGDGVCNASARPNHGLAERRQGATSPATGRRFCYGVSRVPCSGITADGGHGRFVAGPHGGDRCNRPVDQRLAAAMVRDRSVRRRRPSCRQRRIRTAGIY